MSSRDAQQRLKDAQAALDTADAAINHAIDAYARQHMVVAADALQHIWDNADQLPGYVLAAASRQAKRAERIYEFRYGSAASQRGPEYPDRPNGTSPATVSAGLPTLGRRR